MILNEEIKKQLENVNDTEVSAVLRNLKFTCNGKLSFICDNYNANLLYQYIMNLQCRIIELTDENDDLADMIFNIFMHNRFLELEIKELRDDKATRNY